MASILVRRGNLISSFDPSFHFTSFQQEIAESLSRFSGEASDWKSLAAMVVGGLAYRTTKIGVFSVGASCKLPLSRFAAPLFGLASEVTAFRKVNQILKSPQDKEERGEILNRGWLTTFTQFAALKFFGHFAQGQNLVFTHTLQASGMVAGHQLAYGLGLATKPEGNLLNQLVQAEVVNMQLGAGMAMAHLSTGGRLLVFEKSLETLARGPSPKPNADYFLGKAFAAENIRGGLLENQFHVLRAEKDGEEPPRPKGFLRVLRPGNEHLSAYDKAAREIQDLDIGQKTQRAYESAVELEHWPLAIEVLDAFEATTTQEEALKERLNADLESRVGSFTLRQLRSVNERQRRAERLSLAMVGLRIAIVNPDHSLNEGKKPGEAERDLRRILAELEAYVSENSGEEGIRKRVDEFQAWLRAWEADSPKPAIPTLTVVREDSEGGEIDENLELDLERSPLADELSQKYREGSLNETEVEIYLRRRFGFPPRMLSVDDSSPAPAADLLSPDLGKIDLQLKTLLARLGLEAGFLNSDPLLLYLKNKASTRAFRAAYGDEAVEDAIREISPQFIAQGEREPEAALEGADEVLDRLPPFTSDAEKVRRAKFVAEVEARLDEGREFP